MSSMDGNSPTTIILLIVLVAFSAFFSASETAYTCVNTVRLKSLASNGNKRAEKAMKLAADYDKLLSAILIGNNIVNILSASLATILFTNWLGGNGVTISTVVMTIVVLMFGEVAPKSVARVMSEQIALAFYPLLKAVVIILTPFTFLMGKWQALVALVFKRGEDKGVTEDELITMVEEAEHGGEIDKQESELIRSAIEFNDLCAEDILTPRVDIVGIELHDTENEVLSRFEESDFSRLPVYNENIDDIVGILHEKDFFHNRGKKSIQQLMTKPIYVPTGAHLADMMKLFQKTKAHMAVVIDEYGGVKGILTMEDILEELVGEIWDEHDEVTDDFRPQSDGSCLVEGGASLDDFVEKFNLKGEFESVTVSGWIQEETGTIPQEGSTVECEGLLVNIEKVDRHRIQRVRVLKK